MKNVLEYLEHNAALYPNKIAVVDEYSNCSYQLLMDKSQRVGSALVPKVDYGAPVAVMMDKSICALTAFFGIVYAGGFYVMLNPDLPSARLKQIQKILQAKYVISDTANKQLASEVFAPESVLLIDELLNEEEDLKNLESIRDRMIDTDPLYTNFTSGSTGIPKGVVVSHRSVIDFINVFTDLFEFSNEDVIANQAPFDFDVSVKDIYSTIQSGATMVIVPKHLFSQPKELIDFICDHKITTMIWAVSALCLISTFHGLDYRVPQELKKVLFSGEVMPIKHLRTWREHLPNTQFVNLYGPTEITCNCTYHVLDKECDYEQGIPIGRAFPNEHVFLLNRENKEVTTPDTIGEICVRGSALALGYYRAQVQTDAVFVQNPLNSNYNDYIYRSGDLARYDADGEMYFCGRKDFQIKNMGHRIELEEIERAISNLPGIERCCCVFDEAKQRLYGFYIGCVDKKDLHKQLSNLLPVYMVPGALYALEEFPLTKNGKVDRKCLLERRKKHV